MCFGRAERTVREEEEEEVEGVGSGVGVGGWVLGCLRIETGMVVVVPPEERADGVESRDVAADAAREGRGAELARGCAGGIGGIWWSGLGSDMGDGGPAEVGVSPKVPWHLSGSGKSAK
jgi:hypothetical protein